MTELLLTVEGHGLARDLAVDGDAPVGRLLPALVDALGLEGGAWCVMEGARRLRDDEGLAVQRVLHGAVLRVLPA